MIHYPGVEGLSCLIEIANEGDPYAVAIKEGSILGNVPHPTSAVCNLFLQCMVVLLHSVSVVLSDDILQILFKV